MFDFFFFFFQVYIINNDYIPTHFLSLFKNFVQLLDQETTLDDKIQNIKRLLKFIEWRGLGHDWLNRILYNDYV